MPLAGRRLSCSGEASVRWVSSSSCLLAREAAGPGWRNLWILTLVGASAKAPTMNDSLPGPRLISGHALQWWKGLGCRRLARLPSYAEETCFRPNEAREAGGRRSPETNARFLILPWVRVPRLASHLLARVARRLAPTLPHPPRPAGNLLRIPPLPSHLLPHRQLDPRRPNSRPRQARCPQPIKAPRQGNPAQTPRRVGHWRAHP